MYEQKDWNIVYITIDSFILYLTHNALKALNFMTENDLNVLLGGMIIKYASYLIFLIK